MNLEFFKFLVKKHHRTWQNILLLSFCLSLSGNTVIRYHFAKTTPKLSLEERISLILWRSIDSTAVYETEQLYSSGTIGIVYHNISVPSLIESLNKFKAYPANNSFLFAGDPNTIKGILTLPVQATISNIRDTSLRNDYFEEVKHRLDLLNLQIDISASSLQGYSFTMLDSSHIDDISLRKAFNSFDGIIAGSDYDYWKNKLIRLVKSGEIPLKLLNRKVEYARNNKRQIIEQASGNTDFADSQIANPVYLKHWMNNPELEGLNSRLYQNSFSIIKDSKRAIPIRNLNGTSHAAIQLGVLSEEIFQKYLNKYIPVTMYSYDPAKTGWLLQKLSLYDRVFIQFENDVPEDVFQLLNDLRQQTDLFISYLGDKENLYLFDNYSTLISHPEANRYTRQIAAQIFFGGMHSGKQYVSDEKSVFRLGHSSPESAGMDSQTLEQIDKIISFAIRDTTFPGCQVLVAKGGKVVYDKNFGHLTYDNQIPVTHNTIYDLASLTKVLATVPAVMILESSGKIDLDAKLSFYLPELKHTNKTNMIIRDIMIHQAGLYPYWPFWKQTVERGNFRPEFYGPLLNEQYTYEIVPGVYSNRSLQDSTWKWILDSKLVEVKKPKESYPYIYSDFGFIMLQKLVEQYLHTPLDSFAVSTLYQPMGMHQTTFNPDCIFPLDMIAPTEFDAIFRKSLIHGTVHDQTASLMGGVAGNAGLFSNATDLVKYIQMYIQGGTYGGIQYFTPGQTKQYTSKQYKNNRRGLGWDKKDWDNEGNSSCFSSKDAFGHTGFSGTSIWADPEFELIYVFLSNRVYPDSENFKLAVNSIRTRIHDVIYKSIWNYQKTHTDF